MLANLTAAQHSDGAALGIEIEAGRLHNGFTQPPSVLSGFVDIWTNPLPPSVYWVD